MKCVSALMFALQHCASCVEWWNAKDEVFWGPLVVFLVLTCDGQFLRVASCFPRVADDAYTGKEAR